MGYFWTYITVWKTESIMRKLNCVFLWRWISYGANVPSLFFKLINLKMIIPINIKIMFSLLQVSKQDRISLKVCHRCVYNLKLSVDFVKLFKLTRRSKTCQVSAKLCYFCLGNECGVYDIESHVDEKKCTVCKIEQCFSSEASKKYVYILKKVPNYGKSYISGMLQ